MIDYVKQLANTILLTQTGQRPPVVYKNISTYELLAALRDELYRLDPRDFEPSTRHDFVVARAALKAESENQSHNTEFIPDLVNAILPHLEHFAGEGTFAKTRDFSEVKDAKIRAIVERDNRELSMRAFPDGAWKSTVILAGGILEAVLYDRLTSDAAVAAKANACPQAPKGKDITKHDKKNEWTLNEIIKVACDLKILPYTNELAIHEVLREYRNYVHPRAEVRAGMSISPGHATASKGMLDVLLDQLQKP